MSQCCVLVANERIVCALAGSSLGWLGLVSTCKLQVVGWLFLAGSRGEQIMQVCKSLALDEDSHRRGLKIETIMRQQPAKTMLGVASEFWLCLVGFKFAPQAYTVVVWPQTSCQVCSLSVHFAYDFRLGFVVVCANSLFAARELVASSCFLRPNF